MSTESHTYGPTCSLSADRNEIMLRKGSSTPNQPPKLKAHFFYKSLFPIDDPLASGPQTVTSLIDLSSIGALPFTPYDNAALEEAWLRVDRSCSLSRSQRLSRSSLRFKNPDEIEVANEVERLSEVYRADQIGQATTLTLTLSSDGTFALPNGEPYRQQAVQVPVGASRLHLVDLPALRMKPIYWSPINDVSLVVRGTWFYKSTMLPVESEIANQLEEGYRCMQAWTVTYTEEVNSCLSSDAEAECKVVYMLWQNHKATGHEAPSKSLGGNLPDSGSKLEGATQRACAATEVVTSYGDNQAAGDFKHTTDPLYLTSGVIYANDREAQILKPSLLPSKGTFFGPRRPLTAIRQGRVVGIPVVRGFDHSLWEKLHPSKKTKSAAQAKAGAEASRSGVAATRDLRNVCPACTAQENRPKVTDLVLVIHGIGQKLSERVESFRFTHSINSLRGKVNIELESGIMRRWLRKDFGGIMVLPINWRSTMSLDDERENETQQNMAKSDFTLKDITVPTIPVVRNMISDVMLDIPYYLSEHKPKMIAAVTREANRIYRLWCANNPEFANTGRVHLIAHSLGSVMAVDILSKQPTRLPATIDLHSQDISTDIFEFDTKSVFFCGSPTGFFLLLNKASLIPRRGREKPGLDPDNVLGAEHEGEAGTWGCLAVDNVYNIMHKNDPIAYRLNACVSISYSKSLVPATVPSLSMSWLQSLSTITARTTLPATNLDTPSVRPAVTKLRSTVELETHDFRAEEVAERKMYRLNDNGQIDYYLSSGGGPLEMQYFNMLSAHSSYWVLRDFVRFVVVEVGRGLGKSGTVAVCRAVKKGWQGEKVENELR